MPAFFVHGVPETHRLWDPVLGHLSREDLIAVDLPGFGAPFSPGFAATKEAYVEWLIERIEAIGEPVDLVAHDWGAMLTLRVASLRPDLVRSWAGGGCAIDAQYEWHPLAKLWQTPGRGEAYFDDLDRGVMADRLAADGSSPEEVQRIVSAVDTTMGACILALYRSAVNAGAEWQPGLAAVTAPALVLHGLRDQPVPPRYAEQLARDIRATDLVLLEAGHWFPLQQPGEVAKRLEEHWRP